MNIDQLYTVDSHEKGAEMQVKDQNGNSLDMHITVAGTDSKVFRNAKTEMMRDIVSDDNSDKEEIRAKALAAVTLSWRGFLNKGKEFTFSQEKAEKLYINAPYVMDQVDKFIGDRANFMKA